MMPVVRRICIERWQAFHRDFAAVALERGYSKWILS
jgi:hypothetical protein